MTTTATRTPDGSLRIVRAGAPAEPVPAPAALVAKAHRAWEEFEGSLRKSLEKAIALGKALLAMKEKCQRSRDFGRHFSDGKRPFEEALPFTSSWARRLMVMAGNDAVANRAHEHELPADLLVVYELATMTAPALEKAIEAGTVTKDTTRAQAKAIKRGDAPPAKARKVPEEAPSKRDQLKHLCDAFCDKALAIVRSDERLKSWLVANLNLTIQKVNQ